MIKGTVVVDKKCQKHTSHPLTATAVVRDSRGPGKDDRAHLLHPEAPLPLHGLRGGQTEVATGRCFLGSKVTLAALAMGGDVTRLHLCSLCSHSQPLSCFISPWVKAP